MRRTMWPVLIAVVAAVTGIGSAGPAAADTGANAVVNGTFETGTFSGWTTGGASTSIVATAHGGTAAAQLGAAAPTNGNSTMQQTVTVPVNATLSFWYQPHCPDTLTHDQEQMQIRTTSGATLVRVLNVCSNSGAWTQVSRSLASYRGRTVVLWFNSHDDNHAGDATYTLFDDVTVGGPVAPNDFSMAANPAAVTVAPGASGTTTVSTSVTSGSAQSVTLSASGLPAGASASFNPASVVAGAASTLTISTATATPAGTSTVTVTGTGASASHSTTVALTVPAPPPPGLLALSHDPYTNTSSEHATEVEPDTLSNGPTLVSAFQVGRFTNGGSNDIGWATSTDGGQHWSNGLLSGITTFQGGGTWARASDPSVAYDAKHGVWLIASLVLDSSATGRGVAVNRSTDGVTWGSSANAVTSTGAFLDKDWIVCDRTASSPNYGNCYIEYDNNSSGNLVEMLTSTDGGITWSTPHPTADNAHGLGGQPLVQPNGTVVVPYLADGVGQIRSFVSTNGGTTWGASVLVSASTVHTVAAGMRTSALPSAEIDAAGTVYLTWQDCRFRSGCSANDIVLSTSSSGTAWSPVLRIPIDAATGTVDHFIPGLAVDPATTGTSAHLGLYYYDYPNAACSTSTCQLDVGFVSSTDGGATWTGATQVAGPMKIAQIAATTEGAMVGDYISASFLNGRAYPVFSVGLPATGTAFNEAAYTVIGGLAAQAGTHRTDVGTGTATPATPAGPASPASPTSPAAPARPASAAPATAR
jgi:hypothetical protein